MGLTGGLAPLIGGAVQGISSIFGGNAKATAASDAANAQVNAAGQGINSIQNVMGTQTANSQPYLSAGSTSIGQLMQLLQNGTFGAGSLGAVPNFSAPTLADAMNSPGYQFTSQEGTNSILKGAAAAGGSITGGTLKALDQYNTGLANNTYGDVFNRSLQGYNAALAGFNAKQSAQQQAFNQLFAPAQLGASAASSLNGQLGTDAHAISDLFTQQGNARAAGIVGSANNTWGGIQSGTNSILGGSNGGNLGSLMSLFSGMGGGVQGAGSVAAPPSSLPDLGSAFSYLMPKAPASAPYVPPAPTRSGPG
jgi:hypothetical protein